LAVWNKYPNPISLHVRSADILSRRVDPIDGCLYSTRLFTKHGIVPKWGRWALTASESYIIEESVVDPVRGIMTTNTRNLSFRRIMQFSEMQVYTRVGSDTCVTGKDPPAGAKTSVDTHAVVSSSFGWGLSAKIERFGHRYFADQLPKSRDALHYAINRLRRLRLGGDKAEMQHNNV
jgi:hypothetical protein